MPSYTIADLSRAATDPTSNPRRIEALSFFLVILLVSGLIIQEIWNSLRKEFPQIHRISYSKALGVCFLWGLLFTLILTMISGERELMTPGAWEKKGITHRLVEDPSLGAERQISARFNAIVRLGNALKHYAEAHNKSYPPKDSTQMIPDRLWQIPLTSGQRYIYVGGTYTEYDWIEPARLLLYENEAVGNDRLVLMTDGNAIWMPVSEIEKALKREKQ